MTFKQIIRKYTFLGKYQDQLRKLRHTVALRAGRILAFDSRLVVFSSFSGRSYSDNPRCISEKLHEMAPDAHISWILANPDEWRDRMPDYVRVFQQRSSRASFELGRARVWVDNFTKWRFLKPKRGKQFYMQTWHGDRAFKKIGYDTQTDDLRRVEEDCDVFLTGSTFGERMYGTAFRFHGPFLKYGCPRNDILVRNDPAEIAAARRKIGVPEGTRLLLYAPTYRETTTVVPKEAQMDLLHTLDQLEATTGERWLCLYRAHYLSTGIDLSSVKDRLIDMTRYDDMAELLLAADMLLTDYSSSAMDYAILNRPVLLYQADIEDYLSHRGMYFRMSDSPFLVAMNQAELDALIARMTPELAAQNCRAIRDFFGFTETGRATEEACKYIIDKLK